MSWTSMIVRSSEAACWATGASLRSSGPTLWVPKIPSSTSVWVGSFRDRADGTSTVRVAGCRKVKTSLGELAEVSPSRRFGPAADGPGLGASHPASLRQ